MKLLIVWFLLTDEWLHASMLIRDLETIADKGHDVTCIFPATKNALHVDHKNLKIHVVRIGRYLPIVSYLRFCLAAVPRLIKDHQDSDVVVLGVDVVPLLLPLLCLWRRVGQRHRSAFAVRETSPPAEIRSTHMYYLPVFRYLSLAISHLSDMVFVISPMRANEIVAKFRIPSHQVRVWPSSVDTGLFNPRLYVSDRERIRKELGVQNSLLLIYHGDLSHERGLYELVEAIRIVREEREDVALLLLGKGQAKQRLQALARSSRMDDAIIFHGSVAHVEVPKFIAAADAGVVPLPDQRQWRQQVPIKLLEYLAMGKPVIVTDIPGHRWIVGDERFAFFCNRGRPAEIAEAIHKYLRAERISRESGTQETRREEITARFSPDAIADGLLHLFAERTSHGSDEAG